ncbi:MAG: pyridoxamine 5'-phosphate oxidase family protein [Candidatus Micrarchaeaceae archaeon]
MVVVREVVWKYLQEARLMQLATSADGQPWVCSVWFAADKDLNLYYMSWAGRRHSKEAIKNKMVAGAIAMPQDPEDPPRGIQFQGTEEVLDREEDIQTAMSVYSGRVFPKDKIMELMGSKAHPHKFYMIKPALYVLFDAVNFPDAPRQELEL